MLEVRKKVVNYGVGIVKLKLSVLLLLAGSSLETARSAVRPTMPGAVGLTTMLTEAFWFAAMAGNVHEIKPDASVQELAAPLTLALTKSRLEDLTMLSVRPAVLSFGPTLVTFKVAVTFWLTASTGVVGKTANFALKSDTLEIGPAVLTCTS